MNNGIARYGLKMKKTSLIQVLLTWKFTGWSTRMFMILEVDESFTFERKAAMDASNLKVQEWEALMWKFQQALPGSKPGEKWRLMDLMYQLKRL